MKIKTIEYCKTYQPFNFTYDKIGVREDFPADKPDEECIQELKARCDKMAKAMYPHLFPSEEQIRKAIDEFHNTPVQFFPKSKEDHKEFPAVPNILSKEDKEKKELERRIVSMAQDIETVTDLKVLEGYKLIVKQEKYKPLREVYNKKLKELNESVSDLTPKQ